MSYTKSITIWLTTNIAGTLGVLLTSSEITWDIALVGFCFTTIFSLPAIPSLVLLMKALNKISSSSIRIITSCALLFLLSSVIVMAFILILDIRLIEFNEFLPLIIPYFLAAQVSFLSFTKFSNHESKNDSASFS